jgi:hypothetical protein
MRLFLKGIKEISVFEFGVADGYGLLAMAEGAAVASAATQVKEVACGEFSASVRDAR